MIFRRDKVWLPRIYLVSFSDFNTLRSLSWLPVTIYIYLPYQIVTKTHETWTRQGESPPDNTPPPPALQTPPSRPPEKAEKKTGKHNTLSQILVNVEPAP